MPYDLYNSRYFPLDTGDNYLADPGAQDLLTASLPPARSRGVYGSGPTMATPDNPYGSDPMDLMLGLEQPAMQPEVQDPGFDPGRFGGFLENLASSYQPLQQPIGFGQAFANSLLGGLAQKGKGVAQKRAVHEQQLLKRRTERDAANLAATQRYQDTRSNRMGQVAAEERSAARASATKNETYNRDTTLVTPTLLRSMPYLAGRGVKAGDRIPNSVALAKPETVNSNGEDAAAGLTDAAKRLGARQYLQSGVLPTLGMGKQAAKDRRDILNMAAVMNPEGAVAANKAALAANTSALVNMQKQRDNIVSQEETANANAAVMEAVLPKIPDTGTTIGNWAARKGATLLGSDAMASFNGALETVRPEFARILNGTSGGNAPLSDSQKRDLSAVIAGDYTGRQIKAALAVLRQDVKNRRAAMDGQIADIQKRIAEGGTLETPQANAQPAVTQPSAARPPLTGGWH